MFIGTVNNSRRPNKLKPSTLRSAQCRPSGRSRKHDAPGFTDWGKRLPPAPYSKTLVGIVDRWYSHLFVLVVLNGTIFKSVLWEFLSLSIGTLSLYPSVSQGMWLFDLQVEHRRLIDLGSQWFSPLILFDAPSMHFHCPAPPHAGAQFTKLPPKPWITKYYGVQVHLVLDEHMK